MEINKIYNMDCMEGIKDIPNKSVDLIIFDPPYSRFSGSDGVKTNIGDYKILEVYFKELSYEFKRIIKDTGAVFGFCDFRTYPCLYYGMFYNFQPANLIIWKKNFLGPGINFRPLHELIVYWKCDKTLSPKDRNVTDIWDAPRVKHNDKEHTYQKPVQLMRLMIENCSNKGGLILDPFMGTGTTAVACKQLDRNFIGFEIDMNYVKIAEKRLKQNQLKDDGGTNFTKSSADDFPTESLISVKRESADSPNSPQIDNTNKEEANFS